MLEVALSAALLAACAGIGQGRADVSLNLCKFPKAKPVLPLLAIVMKINSMKNDFLPFRLRSTHKVIKLGSDKVLSQMLQSNIRFEDSPETYAAIDRKHLKEDMETHVNNTITC